MKYLLLNFAFLLVVYNLSSRSFRLGQIPNGNVNRCSNCHISSAGGGPLTPFGMEVSNNFLKDGNVVWNSTLASIDSDGDGFTNGQELQDPEGKWKIGDPNPGESSLVSNPGDSKSVPNVSAIQEFALKSGFYLISISPNPIISNANIFFTVASEGQVSFNLINSIGMVFQHKSFMTKVGENSLNLNLKNYLSNGVYFLKITYNGYTHFEKIVVSN